MTCKVRGGEPRVGVLETRPCGSGWSVAGTSARELSPDTGRGVREGAAGSADGELGAAVGFGCRIQGYPLGLARVGA